MKDNNELYSSMLVSTVKAQSENRTIDFNRLLIALLLYAGAEAVTVIFRKNFRKNSVSILAFVVSCISFAGISVISFWQMMKSNSDADYFRGAIYGIITLFVAWEGISKLKKANDNNSSPNGESQLLAFLMKENTSPGLIQYLFEPLVVIAIGIFYSFFDIWGGLPLIVCGVSVWAKWVINFLFLDNRIQRSVNKIGEESNSSSSQTRYAAN